MGSAVKACWWMAAAGVDQTQGDSENWMTRETANSVPQGEVKHLLVRLSAPK